MNQLIKKLCSRTEVSVLPHLENILLSHKYLLISLCDADHVPGLGSTPSMALLQWSPRRQHSLPRLSQQNEAWVLATQGVMEHKADSHFPHLQSREVIWKRTRVLSNVMVLLKYKYWGVLTGVYCKFIGNIISQFCLKVLTLRSSFVCLLDPSYLSLVCIYKTHSIHQNCSPLKLMEMLLCSSLENTA